MAKIHLLWYVKKLCCYPPSGYCPYHGQSISGKVAVSFTHTLSVLLSSVFPGKGSERGVRGGTVDKKTVAFAGYLAIAGALMATAALLMYHLYRFFALEVALRRRSVPFTFYPPKGSAYPAGDVHTACAVCISDYRRFDRVAVLPACGHVFHRRCLRVEVAGASPRCPLCRAAL